MTANSQLISVKLLQGLLKRSDFRKRIASGDRLWRWARPNRAYASKKRQTWTLPAVDGQLYKRLFDVCFATLVLIFCSPLYLILAALIKIGSPGPIFYVQQRVGKDFRRFNCIKFRTMVDNADDVLQSIIDSSPQLRHEFEHNFKLKDDPRVTWIGRFLRVTSLDEFPQFWNVLKGDMSVVGPRPLVPEELDKYGKRIETVLTIRPGITGLWQVSGRNDIPYPLRVKIDAYYATSSNWLLDLSIVIKTIGVIIFPRNNGAY